MSSHWVPGTFKKKINNNLGTPDKQIALTFQLLNLTLRFNTVAQAQQTQTTLGSNMTSE